MKCFWLLIVSLIGFAGDTNAQQAPPFVLADGFDDLAARSEKVRDATEVERSPLFDDAPFLHLRPGDQLVRAKIDSDGRFRKYSGPEGVNTLYNFVRSKGRYFRFEASVAPDGSDDKPFCAAEDSVLFDWAMTAENVEKLHRLWLSQHAIPLSDAQCGAVVRRVGKEFPDLHVALNSGLQEDRFVSIADRDFAVLQGWAYDRSLNCIYRYTMKIGPGMFTTYVEPIVQGPTLVDRAEFERRQIPGSPPPAAIDPKTARKKRAAFDKMVRFQGLIEEIIHPKEAPPSPKSQ